jgi:antitoxin MazE6
MNSERRFRLSRREAISARRLTVTSDHGNTTSMKVAVSIPDEVFAETEDLAKRLGTSRSEIYSRALKEFLGRHAPDRVTELMNQALATLGEKSDPFVERAARGVLRRVEW